MNIRSVAFLVLCLTFSILAVTPTVEGAAEGNLYVVYVDARPENVALGDKVTIFFNVIYYIETLYCGNISMPAVGLKSASFQLSSATGSITLSDIPIYPTQREGQYTTTLEIKPDYPTGKITVFVDENSLSIVIEDVRYIGPALPVSSVETDDQSDYSIVDVSTPSPTPTPTPTPTLLPSTWVLPLTIIILVIGAILVYLGFKVSRKPRHSE